MSKHKETDIRAINRQLFTRSREQSISLEVLADPEQLIPFLANAPEQLAAEYALEISAALKLPDGFVSKNRDLWLLYAIEALSKLPQGDSRVSRTVLEFVAELQLAYLGYGQDAEEIAGVQQEDFKPLYDLCAKHWSYALQEGTHQEVISNELMLFYLQIRHLLPGTNGRTGTFTAQFGRQAEEILSNVQAKEIKAILRRLQSTAHPSPMVVQVIRRYAGKNGLLKEKFSTGRPVWLELLELLSEDDLLPYLVIMSNKEFGSSKRFAKLLEQHGKREWVQHLDLAGKDETEVKAEAASIKNGEKPNGFKAILNALEQALRADPSSLRAALEKAEPHFRNRKRSGQTESMLKKVAYKLVDSMHQDAETAESVDQFIISTLGYDSFTADEIEKLFLKPFRSSSPGLEHYFYYSTPVSELLHKVEKSKVSFDAEILVAALINRGAPNELLTPFGVKVLERYLDQSSSAVRQNQAVNTDLLKSIYDDAGLNLLCQELPRFMAYEFRLFSQFEESK